MNAVRVMIADDDEQLAADLARALSAWSEIEVVGCAPDGASAVRLFEQTRPRVAIVDLAMPNGDGIEVTRKIRAIDPRAVVLIMTATEDRRSLVHCLQLGARGCLRKQAGAFDYRLAIALAAVLASRE